jgi:hypothetical protein
LDLSIALNDDAGHCRVSGNPASGRIHWGREKCPPLRSISGRQSEHGVRNRAAVPGVASDVDHPGRVAVVPTSWFALGRLSYQPSGRPLQLPIGSASGSPAEVNTAGSNPAPEPHPAHPRPANPALPHSLLTLWTPGALWALLTPRTRIARWSWRQLDPLVQLCRLLLGDLLDLLLVLAGEGVGPSPERDEYSHG